MHVILGVLTSVITILYMLDRLGIDLGGLNPFYWRRRRAWARKHDSDPIYSVEDPIHVAALLVVGVAKLEGDLSAEQKKTAQDLFESKFSLDARGASQLLGSSTHLLGAPQIVDSQLQGLVEKNKGRFSPEQADSMMQMMVEVASVDGELTTAQNEYVEGVRSRVAAPAQRQSAWT